MNTNSNVQPTILIVEDDKTLRENLKDFFTEENFNVVSASNGLLACHKCQQNKEINIVLMDENMPVMNGCEAMKEIKTLRPGLPIISISSKSSKELKELQKEDDYWFDGHQQKPFNNLMGLLDYVNEKLESQKTLKS